MSEHEELMRKLDGIESLLKTTNSILSKIAESLNKAVEDMGLPQKIDLGEPTEAEQLLWKLSDDERDIFTVTPDREGIVARVKLGDNFEKYCDFFESNGFYYRRKGKFAETWRKGLPKKWENPYLFQKVMPRKKLRGEK